MPAEAIKINATIGLTCIRTSNISIIWDMNSHYFKIMAGWLAFFLCEQGAYGSVGVRLSSYTMSQEARGAGVGLGADLTWNVAPERFWEFSYNLENYSQTSEVTSEGLEMATRFAWNYTPWLQMALGPSYSQIRLHEVGDGQQQNVTLQTIGLSTVIRTEKMFGDHVAIGLTWFEFATPLHTTILELDYEGPKVAQNAMRYVNRLLKKPSSTSTLVFLAPTISIQF